MEVQFNNDDLDRLEADANFTGGFSPAIVKGFHKRLQQIRAAQDERIFYALRSLNFEKLKGKRSSQYSMRINDQWRLILEFQGKSNNKIVIICLIEDYH